MCGIAGLINLKEENRAVAKNMFKSVLMANEARGQDSTGVLAIDRESNSFSLFKDTIPASQFLKRKKFRQTEGDVWIGHTRLATTGKVNIRNAHPLQRKDIFLVHNGMIGNHDIIGKQLDFTHEVDSEVLIPIVEQENWKLLQEIRGSANFIAWDKNKEVIYVERHNNPLYFLTLKGMQILLFSSVKEVLEFIAGHYEDEAEVCTFDEDTLITLNMKGEVVGKEKNLQFPTVYAPTYAQSKSIVPATTVPIKNKFGDERYPEFYDYLDYDEYEASTHNGNKYECEVCGSTIDKDELEYGQQAWGYPLCYSCLTELEEVHEMIRDGVDIDLNSNKWVGFEEILSQYIT